MKYLGMAFGGNLSVWKTRHLSMGGRLTLIKFVLCFIPVYPLSVKLFSVKVRKSLHGIMSRFLCGGTENKRKIHLVEWDRVTSSCAKRELGIPDLGDMNVALFVKWIFRYGNKIDRL